MKRALAIATMVAVVLVPAAPAGGAWIGFYGKVKHYRRGEGVNVYAGAFFPRYLCSRKIKFRLKDSDGKKFRMKSLKPEAEGLLSSRNDETYIGPIPNEAAFGRAKLRAKQKCGRFLSTGDTKTIYILRPAGVPRIVSATAPDSIGGETVELRLNIDMLKWTLSWMSVTIEYEVLPDVWLTVDTVTSAAMVLEGGILRIPWKARLDSTAPGGNYRFNVRFTRDEFDGGALEQEYAEFALGQPLTGAEAPLDGAVNSNDQLVVADTGEDALIVYSEQGLRVGTWTADGLSDPKDLDFGPDGKIYVADYGNDRIAVLSPTGEFVDEYGEGINGPFGGRDGPDGIAVDAVRNRIYVADRGAGVVWAFPLNSDTSTPIEIEPPEFDSPQDVAVASDGSIYVADERAESLFHVSPAGALLDEIPIPIVDGPIRSVSIDPNGRIYVVGGSYVGTPTGHYEHEIFIFEPDGTLIERIGRPFLRDTSGVVAAGTAGDVYVMEHDLGTIFRFRSP